MKIGRSWFEGFQNFDNVLFTYMAHFANYTDKANSVLATQEALRNIGSKLDSVEIGNEYNFYPGDSRRGDFNPARLVSQWSEYKTAIESATGALTWQTPVLWRNSCPWCVSNLFKQGFDSQQNNIRTASIHHYMEGATTPDSLQSNYMNHTSIAAKLGIFSTAIAWLKANRPRVALVFGEKNSNIDTAITSGNNVTLGVFGSALWLADYMLYGMTMGAKRMNVQQSTGFTYTSWRGVSYNGKPYCQVFANAFLKLIAGLPPAVMPPYYAHPFVADIIGKTGDIRIKDLDLGQDTFAAYGVWNASSGNLKRLVLFNLETWRTTDSTSRPSRSVNLQVGSVTGTFTVDKLTAPGADTIDASQVSWKGISWTYASNGKGVQGPSTSTTVRGANGQIGPISVKASEAVVVNFSR